MHHLELCDEASSLGNVEHDPRAEKRREQVHQEAQNQCYGKPLYLVCAYVEQHDTRDDCREMSIDNRHHSAAETVTDRHSQRGAAFKLFANTLVNEHVCIDRHTHRERESRKTW